MNKSLKYFVFILLLGFSSFAQTSWKFDKSHTQIKFSVIHLLITEVEGYFEQFSGSVVTSGDEFEKAKISFKIEVNSINTDNEKRDGHLKSEDFFAAEEHPYITFESKSFTSAGENNYKVVGDFTMRGITKEIELNAQFNGIVSDPWGNTKAGFQVTGSLNRFDYGLKWNKLIETGGAVVSEEVNLILNIQITKE